eukprot:1987593-Amphidinium_carterae.2
MNRGHLTKTPRATRFANKQLVILQGMPGRSKCLCVTRSGRLFWLSAPQGRQPHDLGHSCSNADMQVPLTLWSNAAAIPSAIVATTVFSVVSGTQMESVNAPPVTTPSNQQR